METPENNEMKANRRTVQASTTLSRKYTRRPKMGGQVEVSIKKSPEVRHFQDIQAPTKKKEQRVVDSMQKPTVHPMQVIANNRMQTRAQQMNATQPTTQKVSAKELKDQAIKKALAAANKVPEETESPKKVRKNKMHFGFGRVMLALSCAMAAVVAIVYFVNLNMPDISLRVAAMQTGMEPSFPNYVPRNYSASGITSEEGKITIDFKNSVEGTSFTLSEEKSSWDTNALLTNFVKPEYGENYSVVREQGLTIYISGSDAAWVNGGNVFKIKAKNGTLTNKQIRSIAVSL